MELKVPLVVVQHGRRLVEAWVPTLDGVGMTGPSLAEIKDDLRLKVMQRFVDARPEEFTRYQVAPHARVEVVSVEAVVQDPERRARWELSGRLGVLVEKFPADTFRVVTPTRLPRLRFALRADDELAEALARRVAAWCREARVTDLAPHASNRRERLELLDVDAYPPSIFPVVWQRAPGRRPKPPRVDPDAPDDEEDERETADQREERRRVRRLSVSALRDVGKNLSYGALDDTLGRAFGRDAAVDALVDEFAGREGVAVVIVGPSGSGKTAVVHEFVRRLAAWNARNVLRRDVWRVDGNRFIAGMKYVGQWESRAREMISELIETGDVLYLDDLASMVHAGRTGKSETNVAQFLEPHIARGELAVIAESTPERLAWAREESPAFARLFRVVHLDAMTERETLPVLLGALRDLEEERAPAAVPPRVSPAALATALTLTRRFQPTVAFPGKAVRLLRAVLDGPGEEVAARDGRAERRFSVRDVLTTMRQRTGLPDFVLDEAAARPRAEIRALLGAQVAGQPEAVEALTDLVVAMQQVLCDPAKPLGTFLFVGPTGVGKTESAKALARLLFGSEDRILRFDMSEFASAWSVTRLLGHPGAPDGELTSALRVQPFCVILFDEVEKAHPRVFDAMLQLLGEGRISDASGRLADARQAVIVLTSNLGVREASSQAGFSRGEADEAKRHYLSAAQRFFRPEFFNRIDRVVAFQALDRAALRVVVEHNLADLLGRRGIERANVLVDVEPELLDVLVERAYDPRYGARPLKRAMERRLTVPLAHHLVRRRADDLSLVSLHRRGDDMALDVRALPDAVAARSLPPPLDALARVRAALAALRAQLDALAASAVVSALEDRRAEALRGIAAGDAREAPMAIELLDRLTALRAQLDAAEEDERFTEGYVEEAVSEDARDIDEHQSSVAFHTRYRGGLRPRAGYIERPTRVNEEHALRAARDVLRPLTDAAAALRLRLDAAARGPEEVLSVVIEPLAAGDAGAAVCALLDALPWRIAHARAWVEWREPGGAARWSEGDIASLLRHDRAAQAARACVTLRGFALRGYVDALSGFALAELPGAAGPRRALLRVQVLDGAASPEAMAARDAARADARARRWRAEGGRLEEVPDRVTLRGDGARWRHVATGLDAGAHESVLAALGEGG